MNSSQALKYASYTNFLIKFYNFVGNFYICFKLLKVLCNLLAILPVSQISLSYEITDLAFLAATAADAEVPAVGGVLAVALKGCDMIITKCEKQLLIQTST